MPHTRRRTNKRGKGLIQSGKSNVFYVVDIVGWSWSAAFGLWEVPGTAGKSYHDLRHLKVDGRFIQPAQFFGVEANFTFVPDERLNRENRGEAQPRSIGRLRLSEPVRALVSIPSDVVPCLLTMLCAEQFKYLVLSGAPARNRQSDLLFFSFETKFDIESVPQ